MKINKVFFLLFCGVHSFSQDFVSTAKVEYEMITNINGSFQNPEAYLYFNNMFSRFDFKNKETSDKISEIKNVENVSKIMIKKADTTTSSIFINPAKNVLYEIAYGEVIFEDNNLQNWELIDEQKVIGNFQCSKAICSFRGRDYTAWYANSIPVVFGPWKFNGLPGLIVEIYDSKKEVYMSVKKINMPFSKNINGIDPNKTLISREEAQKKVTEKLAKQKKDLEERARIIESSFSKENKVKIKVSEPILSKGIEIE
ncbi:GLPGLI family protein [Flavobacterium sp.]|uniref:GLPGLI family protein n=1 Tax=Flavobacterium sp. TaxID=239 RepID=UPI003D6C15A6